MCLSRRRDKALHINLRVTLPSSLRIFECLLLFPSPLVPSLLPPPLLLLPFLLSLLLFLLTLLLLFQPSWLRRKRPIKMPSQSVCAFRLQVARRTSRPRPTKLKFHRPRVQRSRPDLQESERQEKTHPFQKQSSLLLLKTPQSQSQVDIATLPLQKSKSQPSETRSRVLRLRCKA